MPIPRHIKRLAKFASYVLGRRPDEFGLIPDSEGYVSIKEFLKAVTEEDGWKSIRRSHLNEMMLTLTNSGIEITEKHIRAVTRDKMPTPQVTENPPKLLYTCVRQKAYPYVQDKGIYPAGQPKVVLTSKRSMAERIGRRKDPSPVTLTVNVEQAEWQGVVFFELGEQIYLAKEIPTGCFTGPPLPKEKPKPLRTPEPRSQPTPGTFVLDGDRIQSPLAPPRSKKRGKANELKKHKRGRKREKPPWRS